MIIRDLKENIASNDELMMGRKHLLKWRQKPK